MRPERPPFLTIVTRVHPSRLGMLVKLGDSIRRQERVKWVQVDDPGGPTGRAGIARMNRVLSEFDVSSTSGYYIWVVDDDDVVETDFGAGFASEMLTLNVRKGLIPPWVMVRAYLGSEGERHDGEWPRPWGERWTPAFGNVSMLNLLVRRDIFEQHQSAMAVDVGADLRLCRSMWEAGLRPYFYDVLAARTQRISDGQAEPNPPEILDFTAPIKLVDPDEDYLK